MGVSHNKAGGRATRDALGELSFVGRPYLAVRSVEGNLVTDSLIFEIVIGHLYNPKVQFLE